LPPNHGFLPNHLPEEYGADRCDSAGSQVIVYATIFSHDLRLLYASTAIASAISAIIATTQT
jgi:hypothetical protein